jgi:pimeloyl-ACP methyl ester carboxylesterase
MEILRKDGIALGYEDTKTDQPSLVLLHGCGFDHASLTYQAQFFAESHRVISIDFRGHGISDAPENDYTMRSLADDVMWLCTKLSVSKPLIVGHSMGGNVALEVSARYPDFPSAIVMIDSCVLPSQAQLDYLEPHLEETFRAPDHLEAYRQLLSGMCLPTDTRSSQLLASLHLPRHVLASVMRNHTTNYDGREAAVGCHVPIAYIFSIMPFLDLDRFRSLTPQLICASTLGAGHLSPMEVPDQINAMIAQFIRMQSLSR